LDSLVGYSSGRLADSFELLLSYLFPLFVLNPAILVRFIVQTKPREIEHNHSATATKFWNFVLIFHILSLNTPELMNVHMIPASIILFQACILDP
jgi:hypothetical protein